MCAVTLIWRYARYGLRPGLTEVITFKPSGATILLWTVGTGQNRERAQVWPPTARSPREGACLRNGAAGHTRCGKQAVDSIHGGLEFQRQAACCGG
jgi:hypothetical protein